MLLGETRLTREQIGGKTGLSRREALARLQKQVPGLLARHSSPDVCWTKNPPGELTPLTLTLHTAARATMGDQQELRPAYLGR